MNYLSTRSGNTHTNFCEAMKTALAPDGGLFVPASFPTLTDVSGSYPELAARILALYTDFEETELLEQTQDNYGEFPIPLVQTDAGNFLELFHGPSGAFKDIALTMLPRMAALCGQQQTSYVTATSGDTGKAAMEALKNRGDAKIMVFYPKDGVAYLQQKQMETQEGDNVRVVAVQGNFDDAQRAVKEILALQLPGVSSCNSINICRLLSQIPYYFSAANEMQEEAAMNFFVPCGNFGNILAGWYAKQMGLPVRKLVVCTNKNTVLRDFFETGVYDRRRTLHKTSSPSMDILVSSNLERLLFHLLGPQETAHCMQQLTEDGVFTVPTDVLTDFSTYGATEEEAADAIRRVYEEAGYVMDPHTACAQAAWEAFDRPAHSVILSTASPSKFPETILRILEGNDVAPKEALEKLGKYTAIHPCMKDVFDRPVRFFETIDPKDAQRVFTEFHGGQS